MRNNGGGEGGVKGRGGGRGEVWPVKSINLWRVGGLSTVPGFAVPVPHSLLCLDAAIMI